MPNRDLNPALLQSKHLTEDQLADLEEHVDLRGFDFDQPYAVVNLGGDNFLFCNVRCRDVCPPASTQSRQCRALACLGQYVSSGHRCRNTSIQLVDAAAVCEWAPVVGGRTYYYRTRFMDSCGMQYNIPTASTPSGH